MKDTASLWALVHDHLDGRRDPLDDPQVQEHLLSHPELLEEIANLTHAVDTLSRQPSTPTMSRKHIVAVGAIALISFAAAWFWPSDFEPELVLPDLATGGEVMRYSSRSFTTGSNGHLSLEIEAGWVSILERAVLTQIQPRGTTPHGYAIRTEITQQRSRVRAELITE